MTIQDGLVWGSNAGLCAERAARNSLGHGKSDDLAVNIGTMTRGSLGCCSSTCGHMKLSAGRMDECPDRT